MVVVGDVVCLVGVVATASPGSNSASASFSSPTTRDIGVGDGWVGGGMTGLCGIAATTSANSNPRLVLVTVLSVCLSVLLLASSPVAVVVGEWRDWETNALFCVSFLSGRDPFLPTTVVMIQIEHMDTWSVVCVCLSEQSAVERNHLDLYICHDDSPWPYRSSSKVKVIDQS